MKTIKSFIKNYEKTALNQYDVIDITVKTSLGNQNYTFLPSTHTMISCGNKFLFMNKADDNIIIINADDIVDVDFIHYPTDEEKRNVCVKCPINEICKLKDNRTISCTYYDRLKGVKI